MKPRVLIVDDDPDLVELLRLALADAGYSARTVASGEDALRKALRAPPDLVVLDLLLPGINGFSVCQELRRHPATSAIPILMITALPGQFPRLVGVEAGADAYLNKPFRMEDLVACVGELLRRSGAVPEVVAASFVSVSSEGLPAFPAGAAALPGTSCVGSPAQVQACP
jgi:DNA-binding response OmpR family regulator